MEQPWITRRATRKIRLGGVEIGGGAPISIQSMTNTPTADVAATAAQIAALAQAGCEIVRLAVPDQTAAAALPALVKGTSVPLVADIHFDYRLALAAIDSGVQGLRLNPGNIGGRERVRQVAQAAAAAGVPIRIGVNGGSLEKELLAKYGGLRPEALVESALHHVRILEETGFEQIKISLKASSLPLMVDSYRLMAQKVDYPLHLGLTEAGTAKRGSIRSAMALAILLAEGIGDTIRVSLTGDPVAEVWVAQEILAALGLRQQGFTFVSCPTCGRTAIPVERIALEVEQALAKVTPPRPMTVAVMGCVVNGPGEAREADVGIAGGKGEGLLFVQGQPVGKYANEALAGALVDKVQAIIRQETAE